MAKKDDRRDNVKRIQENIDNTFENMRAAGAMINVTSDENTKKDLSEKNKRREKAIEGMKNEIKDEARDRENNYQ